LEFFRHTSRLTILIACEVNAQTTDGRSKGDGGRDELSAVHHDRPQLHCSDCPAASLARTGVPFTPVRGKIARHSSKMFGKKAASALVSHSFASKPGCPTCVLGRTMFNARLTVNVITHG